MYVATVPNRKSPPAILLRESYRQDGKVKPHARQYLSSGLSADSGPPLGFGRIPGCPPATPLPDSFHISLPSSRPCRRGSRLLTQPPTGFHLDPVPSRQRDLVIAMIVARILEPTSKLATARGLHCDTLHHSLGETSTQSPPMRPNSIALWTSCSLNRRASSRRSPNANSPRAAWCFMI